MLIKNNQNIVYFENRTLNKNEIKSSRNTLNKKYKSINFEEEMKKYGLLSSICNIKTLNNTIENEINKFCIDEILQNEIKSPSSTQASARINSIEENPTQSTIPSKECLYSLLKNKINTKLNSPLCSYRENLPIKSPMKALHNNIKQIGFFEVFQGNNLDFPYKINKNQYSKKEYFNHEKKNDYDISRLNLTKTLIKNTPVIHLRKISDLNKYFRNIQRLNKKSDDLSRLHYSKKLFEIPTV